MREEYAIFIAERSLIGFTIPFVWAYALWGFFPCVAVLALEVVLIWVAAKVVSS
jgi:hypothetical protein